MEWDLSRVYTALNADEVKVGSKVIVANNLFDLKDIIRKIEKDEYFILSRVLNEDGERRFCIEGDSCYSFALCYLISEPEEKVLKWTDLKIGDVIRKKDGTSEGMVIQIDKDGGDDVDKDCHICCGLYIADSELAEWEKVE